MRCAFYLTGHLDQLWAESWVWLLVEGAGVFSAPSAYSRPTTERGAREDYRKGLHGDLVAEAEEKT